MINSLSDASLAKPPIATIGIVVIWLFHVSALIGIILGFFDWFVQKTPLNLGLMFLMLVIIFPIRSKKSITVTVFFFLIGLLAEWLGVNLGWLFGSYSYGANLGLKLAGVPLLIGINWAMLALITAAISNHLTKTIWIRILYGALMMVFLDLLMEYSAPKLDFWTFEGGIAPLSNYLGWFIVSIILQFIYQISRIQGHFGFSLHLFVAQCVFFSLLNIYFGL